MTFLGLMVHNVRARKLRAALTAAAVAIGVMTVVSLGIVTKSLKTTAIAVLQTGKADFSVAQKGVSDVLMSSLDEAELARIRDLPQVESALGVLVATNKLNAANPLFLEIGVPPQQLAQFGVQVLQGREYSPTAPDEMMLGWRAAQNLNKHVGDSLVIDNIRYRIVGIFSIGQVFGDSGSLMPLVPLQASERKAGIVTLVFVQARPGANVDALRAKVEQENPQLTTVRTESEFGRVDRNLVLLTAADRGATILALVIGAIIVMNTMLLSFFQRTREFGILRAVGWPRWRILVMVLGEAFIIGLFGAAFGVGLGFLVVIILEHVPELAGVLKPTFGAEHFGRALYLAAGMAFFGSLYPAARAALLTPLEALRRE